uniref:Integrase catalytic domain-containing protein n=1 Tax=Steinernema glaseri TaxID=37863 RepID=A0A1I7ZJ90_9BILA
MSGNVTGNEEHLPEGASPPEESQQSSSKDASPPFQKKSGGRGRKKGRSKQRGAALRRIPIDRITDEIYDAFVEATISESAPEVSEDVQEAVDLMQNSADYAVETNVEDELLGTLKAVILHVPTKRYILTSQQKERALEEAVNKFRGEKFVVGSCLQSIQKSYIGFPPIIQLRNQILEIVERETRSEVAAAGPVVEVVEEEPHPVVESPPPEVEANPPPENIEVVESEQFLLQMQDGGIVRVEEVHPDGSVCAMVGGDYRRLYEEEIEDAYARGMLPVISQQKTTGFQVSSGAIPDSIYDQLAQVLTGTMSLEEIQNWNTREAVRSFVFQGSYDAQLWEKGDEILPGGWKILQRRTGKIVPKRSQCEMIRKRWFEMLSAHQSTSEILRFIDEKYVGVVSQAKIKEAAWLNLLKGARVQFPLPALVYGSKPMQFIQVDIVDMERSTYGERMYCQALLITDLFSQFIFARALSPDTSMIARYLVDIFCGFAPPEGFRSSCTTGTVATLMSDIARMFKVAIKNLGLGYVDHHMLKREMHRRADNEIGDRLRWVEAMPFAVIEYNQKPHRVFDLQVSPFEVMFGRRPWKDVQLPPWVRIGGSVASQFEEGSPLGQRIVVDDKPSTSDGGAPPYLKQTMAIHRKIEQISAGAAVVHLGENSVRDPGTGILFEVGDRVYMRNTEFRDAARRSGDRSRSGVARYFRATIAAVDFAHPDFLYQVFFWPDLSQTQTDHLGNDEWPDGDASSAWVSPYDLSPSTVELSRKRSLFRHKEEQWRCRCGNALCGLCFNDKCPFRMSIRCCAKLNASCPYHRKVDEPTPSKQPTASSGRKRRVFGFGPLEKTPSKKPATLYRDIRTMLPEECSSPSGYE